MASEYKRALLDHVGLDEAREQAIASARLIVYGDGATPGLVHLGGPQVPSPPRLTPDLWRSMACLRGVDPRHCPCDYCAWERRWGVVVEQWHQREQDRPHLEYDHAYGSVRAAIEGLLAHWRDGAPARSRHGALIDRASRTLGLGTEIQVTRRSGDPREIRSTDDAIDVERSLLRVCSYSGTRGDFSTSQAIAAVVLDVDTEAARAGATLGSLAEEWGATERSVASLLRRARRALTVELAAVGKIPYPRETLGLGKMIDARKRELQ